MNLFSKFLFILFFFSFNYPFIFSANGFVQTVDLSPEELMQNGDGETYEVVNSSTSRLDRKRTRFLVPDDFPLCIQPKDTAVIHVQPWYPSNIILASGVPNWDYIKLLEYLINTPEEELKKTLFSPEDQDVFADAVSSKEKTASYLRKGLIIGNFVLLALSSMVFYPHLDPYNLFVITVIINVILYNVPFFATGNQPNTASIKGDEAQQRFDYLQEVFTLASRNLGYYFKTGNNAERCIVRDIVSKINDPECLKKLSNALISVTKRPNGDILLIDVKHMADEIYQTVKNRVYCLGVLSFDNLVRQGQTPASPDRLGQGNSVCYLPDGSFPDASFNGAEDAL